MYRDTATFSSCNSVSGPFPGFPVPLEGQDVAALIEKHRDQLPMSDQLPTLDPPKHTAHRALLRRLLTPRRLKENEAFMWRLADRQIDEFLAKGECEFLSEFASPFALLVIADLLGVPEEDHARFRAQLASPRRAARSGAPARTRWRTTRSSSSISSSPLRRGAAARAAERRPDGPRHREVSRRLRRPRSSTSCASRPTCSRPARRPACVCSRRPSG